MRILNNRILDGEGRTLILRGVNLGGNSKNPFGPPGWCLKPESLSNPADASFIGRPFPPEEAEGHFRRLARAGFTFLRFVITWEALEHAGPGLYDEAFLAYLRKILKIAGQNGISVFMDPHQDVWSRWTGGDGAPAWTLEMPGIDIEKQDITGAAFTRQRRKEDVPHPRMIWPGNYNRYTAATMFSLFFGGKTYAPGLTIEGKNIQDWLQNRYIAAFRHCYRRLKNCTAITGWGVMNEPHNGFIGYGDLEQAENFMIPEGPRPSPWDAIRAASGYAVEVPVYGIFSFSGKSSKYEVFNPRRHSLFREGFVCPWKQAGVWTDEDGKPRLLRKDHFSMFEGRPADFMKDFHKPFVLKYIEKMKEADENTFFFIEGRPSLTKKEAHPVWKKDDPPNTINAFHWYDAFSLFTKHFRPWLTFNPKKIKPILGRKNVQAFFNKCLKKGIKWSSKHMGNMPCLLGEFGLSFDINNRSAYKKGDYSTHEEALSMYYDAVDANLLHSTLWNYTADNTSRYGDGWNDEDLSIFSDGKERATAGWKRPYPMATAGELLSIAWNRKRGLFRCRFIADGSVTAPTVVYLPAERFGPATKITVTPAVPETGTAVPHFEYLHEEQRLMVYNNGFSGETEITVKGS